MTTALAEVDAQQYQFPFTSPSIDDIVSLRKPDDISISDYQLKKAFFDRFVQQVNSWLEWFEKFIDIFSYIIEWLKHWKIDRAEQLLSELNTMSADPSFSVIKMKTTVQDIIEILKPFKHLLRLCDILNCVQYFEVVNAGSLGRPDEHKSFIAKTRKSHPNNLFTVKEKTDDVKIIYISDRRHVSWSLACVQHPCSVKIEYRMSGLFNQSYQFFSERDAPIDRQVLRGEFVSQHDGQLAIMIDNSSAYCERKIWFHATSSSLSTCHLFHGIFTMHYRKYFTEPDKCVKETELNQVLNQVFTFIDRLLDGDITLADIDPLQTVFRDKNINVRQEVQKLFANRSSVSTPTTSNDQAIGQVCQWLETYQYYSHLNNIIECVETFQLIPHQKKDQSIDQLQQLTINADCSLRKISETHSDLYKRFSKLSNEHLQLIKTMPKCSNVVQMMKQSGLYADGGLRRFHELRDNLTTQFQLQERNNLILNSWIITYTLCEPFVRQVHSLEQFIDNVTRLSKIDESALEDIKGMCNEEKEKH